MPIEVTEKFESRQGATGRSPSIELRYTIRGTNDDVAARNALIATAPATYDPWGTGILFLPRDTVALEPVGDALWDGIVRYGPVQANESSFAFDTGGGTQHVTQSKQTVARYPSSAGDCQGAIGVTKDSVEGVDITVPVYQFSETHFLPNSAVTPTYKATLFALTGTVNAPAFRNLAAGECLFLGAAGTRRGNGDWEITYRFAASPNASNLTIGNLTGISKKGWEYLWVRYQDEVRGTGPDAVLVKVPKAVYVERMYDYADFGALEI